MHCEDVDGWCCDDDRSNQRFNHLHNLLNIKLYLLLIVDFESFRMFMIEKLIFVLEFYSFSLSLFDCSQIIGNKLKFLTKPGMMTGFS